MRPKAATMSGAQGQLACVRSFRLRPPHVIRAAACSNSASTFPFTSLRIDARSPGAPRERLWQTAWSAAVGRPVRRVLYPLLWRRESEELIRSKAAHIGGRSRP
jgi:hypothetical protein